MLAKLASVIAAAPKIHHMVSKLTSSAPAPKDGVIPFDLTEKRYDAGGRLVSESTTPAGTKAKSGGIGWPLVAIAGAALLGTLGIARRRRSSGVEAPSPVP